MRLRQDTANLDMRKTYWSIVKVALSVCWSMISNAWFTFVSDTGRPSKPSQTKHAHQPMQVKQAKEAKESRQAKQATEAKEYEQGTRPSVGYYQKKE